MGPKEEAEALLARANERAQDVRCAIMTLKQYTRENRELVAKSRDELLVARAIMQFANDVLSAYNSGMPR